MIIDIGLRGNELWVRYTVGCLVDRDGAIVDEGEGQAGTAQQLAQSVFRGQTRIGTLGRQPGRHLGSINELVARRVRKSLQGIGEHLRRQWLGKAFSMRITQQQCPERQREDPQ